MIIFRLWPSNQNYIDFTCPWCGKNTMYMNEKICNKCNKTLPDINNISINVRARVHFFMRNTRGPLE